MDSKPFFEFDILRFEEHQIAELKKFTKSAFSLEDILTTASTLKYAGAIKKILDDQFRNPSEQYVRFFASQVYEGSLTKKVLEQFAKIVKDATGQYVNEVINERLKSALSANESHSDLESSPEEEPAGSVQLDKMIREKNQDEIDGYNIVRAILCKVVDINRISVRYQKSYSSIVLDNTNRKRICRLHFNSERKAIAVFRGTVEELLPIDSSNDIFKYEEQLKARYTAINKDTKQA